MYRDNSLMPKEAVRLAVVGTLLQHGEMRYAELAAEVRHFLDRIMGPSLDLMGTSLEMLRYEGIIVSLDGGGMEDNALLAATPAGRVDFDLLMRAHVRAPSTDGFNKLVIALKLRFLHLLDVESQRDQVDNLVALYEQERVRLADLQKRHAADAGYLTEWLEHDLIQADERIAWFSGLLSRL